MTWGVIPEEGYFCLVKGKRGSRLIVRSIVSPFAVEMAVSFPFCFALRRLAELLQPIVKRPAL